MNETQRLTYLAHLGIDNYVARKPLKGAAPSVAPQTGSVSPIASKQTAITELAEVKSPVEDRKQQDKLDVTSSSASIRTVTTEADDNSTTAASALDAAVKSPSESIRFALDCWRINDDLLVFDTREPGAALPTDTLLLNIVRSIGCPLAQLPQSELLRWPLFSHDQNANDEGQARAMVQAYIQAQIAKQSVEHLFLMGPDAARFALDKFDDWQSVEGKSFQQRQITLTVIPSLAEMLREPLLKRITWQAIRQLRSSNDGSTTNNNLTR